MKKIIQTIIIIGLIIFCWLFICNQQHERIKAEKQLPTQELTPDQQDELVRMTDEMINNFQ